MALEIGHALFQRREVFLVEFLDVSTAVVLEGADGSLDDAGVGLQFVIASFDVLYFFC
jgi:hypothetical protein